MNAARRLELGAVRVNDGLRFISEMPYDCFKQSGYGKDMSVYAVAEYAQIKRVMVKIK